MECGRTVPLKTAFRTWSAILLSVADKTTTCLTKKYCRSKYRPHKKLRLKTQPHQKHQNQPGRANWFNFNFLICFSASQLQLYQEACNLRTCDLFVCKIGYGQHFLRFQSISQNFDAFVIRFTMSLCNVSRCNFLCNIFHRAAYHEPLINMHHCLCWYRAGDARH